MKLALTLTLCLFPVAVMAGTYNDSNQTITHDCDKDPEVLVNASNSTFTVTGTCKKVAINGSMVTATIASATTVAITGSSNTIDVDASDKITVSGAMNKVSYKKPIAAKKTKVSTTGTGNKVAKAK